MIAVIADDFTGAAEIGGVGLRYGLKVLIETVVNKVEGVDLLVIATDTRSLNADDAALEVDKITRELMKTGVDLIFKKIDSVLRGHVAVELEAQMRVMCKNKALIVAPNPLVGRTIVNGHYFIDSVPLDKTSFAEDPDFPVFSSKVTDLVYSGLFTVLSVQATDSLCVNGLLIADASNTGDLEQWVTKIDDTMVVAGGAAFFDTYLSSMYHKIENLPSTGLVFGESSLFIFGSKFPKNDGLLDRFFLNGVIKRNMPEGVFFNDQECKRLLKAWATTISADLSNGSSVLVTIDHQPSDEIGLSLHLRECIGNMVALVAEEFEIKDLFIEGGATTSVVLNYLNINTLIPVSEIDMGIIQMRSPDYPQLIITTKPGSYLWPEHFVFNKEVKVN